MNPFLRHYIAVDIAKETLCVLSTAGSIECPNQLEGFERLKEELVDRVENAFLVFEATGGYERALMKFLRTHQLPFALVNPARVRHFARSEGTRAKTDPLDAKMLLRFAQEKNPAPTPVPDPLREQLASLLDRRHHYSEQLAREKNRRHHHNEWIEASIARSIAFIEAEIKELDAQIEALLDSAPPLQANAKRLISVIGVGPMTAWTLLAYMPELEHLKRNQVVALAGLAPFNRDSGKQRGRRRIQAGRAKVRRCLYMAAQTAARHNPVIRDYVKGLIERGKHYKEAIVAAMRKILLCLQSLLKNPHFILGS